MMQLNDKGVSPLFSVNDASFCVVQADILDVNQIFRDLGMLVHEQGEVIGNFCCYANMMNHVRLLGEECQI